MAKTHACICPVARAKRTYRGTNRISPRQAEYIKLVFKGLTIAEIAKRMFVCEKAVKYIITILNEKFGTRRRSEWMTKYIENSHPPEIQAQLARITGLKARRGGIHA